MQKYDVLVLGASGFLGSKVFQLLCENNEKNIIGTCFKSNIDELYCLDIKNENSINKFFSMYKFKSIIWAIADMKNENEIMKSGLYNVIKNINKDVRFIFISTTVSSASQQKESILPEYRSEGSYLKNYVNSKIDEEKIIAKLNNYVILRPGSIYGIDGFNRIDRRTDVIKNKVENREFYKRASNICTSFVNVNDLSKAIIELINSNYIGILNIAGRKPISHYEFSLKRATHENIDINYILSYKDKNPREYSLNTSLSRKILKTKINDL